MGSGSGSAMGGGSVGFAAGAGAGAGAGATSGAGGGMGCGGACAAILNAAWKSGDAGDTTGGTGTVFNGMTRIGGAGSFSALTTTGLGWSADLRMCGNMTMVLATTAEAATMMAMSVRLIMIASQRSRAG